MRLFGYWRSSAAYRVRIALGLKGIDCEHVPVDLRAAAQRAPAYAAVNRQKLVPYLEDGEAGIAQSLAIIEHLDERWPEPPLVPGDPLMRARIRSLALLIACEIHPLNNTRTLDYLRGPLGLDEVAVTAWYRHWIAAGLEVLESELTATAGRFCVGEAPTLADLCLVPQVYNARRLECDLEPFPNVRRIDATCRALPAFDRARPEAQPDAPRDAATTAGASA